MIQTTLPKATVDHKKSWLFKFKFANRKPNRCEPEPVEPRGLTEPAEPNRLNRCEPNRPNRALQPNRPNRTDEAFRTEPAEPEQLDHGAEYAATDPPFSATRHRVAEKATQSYKGSPFPERPNRRNRIAIWNRANRTVRTVGTEPCEPTCPLKPNRRNRNRGMPNRGANRTARTGRLEPNRHNRTASRCNLTELNRTVQVMI